ncbi:MAG: hypothetical protein HYT77_06510 [Deltaproteobacteria bacterium]|nr:hypothetical protein [Deltaproteobacteria bacterium]
MSPLGALGRYALKSLPLLATGCIIPAIGAGLGVAEVSEIPAKREEEREEESNRETCQRLIDGYEETRTDYANFLLDKGEPLSEKDQNLDRIYRDLLESYGMSLSENHCHFPTSFLFGPFPRFSFSSGMERS